MVRTYAAIAEVADVVLFAPAMVHKETKLSYYDSRGFHVQMH